MSAGPGKYDDLCTYVREKVNAAGAVVMVFDGNNGSGFSVQADAATTLAMPDLLERIAREMRQDIPGVFAIERHPDDDANIVEVWM
jgi:pyruvate formate-lyase activating enzyme-like uncharacterized protein